MCSRACAHTCAWSQLLPLSAFQTVRRKRRRKYVSTCLYEGFSKSCTVPLSPLGWRHTSLGRSWKMQWFAPFVKKKKKKKLLFLRRKRWCWDNCGHPLFSPVPFFTVSVTCCQLWSENTKWKIPKINSMTESHTDPGATSPCLEPESPGCPMRSSVYCTWLGAARSHLGYHIDWPVSQCWCLGPIQGSVPRKVSDIPWEHWDICPVGELL